ncbi:MAG: cyclic pyranopterin monophosphate synthase MoaC [Phycisphaerae bacterium]|jgi:cyclic pyranopterin monophosphate synthase|nr:cyclic pyranopterin monophosphate synthase MoaC [Phycisphaerae bacterium]MBT5365942.1 cyclic pyranopterin monophosphate synthase MoaC [Phycisphaerae bacterium]MBT6269202.1 cyclic pyranopterin monophosphate synthase MoaC [Phycisphaerae bacterium]MBT6282389.1 cyclic pyranopterin monophosphate synthase MoaC [Phycisphaerae bacterium]
MSERLTHIDEQGKAAMVDVSMKPNMRRTAIAQGVFSAKKTTLDALLQGKLPKGEALAVARIAGIQAAKKCDELIPLCHPLPLEFAEVAFERVSDEQIQITATTRINGRTGIEMEALTAVSVAALTLWDMTKAIDDNLRIGPVQLLEKHKVTIEN